MRYFQDTCEIKLLFLPSSLDNLVAQTSANFMEIVPLIKSSRTTAAKELTPDDTVLFYKNNILYYPFIQIKKKVNHVSLIKGVCMESLKAKLKVMVIRTFLNKKANDIFRIGLETHFNMKRTMNIRIYPFLLR